MQVSVKFDHIETATYAVSIQNQKYTIDSASDSIKVEHEQGEPLEIRIREQPDPEPKITLLRCILWILTFPFRLLMSILTAYDMEPWDKNINPYLMDASLLLRPDKDGEVCVKLRKKTEGSWMKTAVECAEAENVQINYSPYPHGIWDSYLGYAEPVACGSIALTAFSILAFCTSANAAYPKVMLVMGFVLAAIVVAVLGVALAQYFKAKKIYRSFIKLHGMEK